MARKTLTNTNNLLDLIERAPASVLRVFSGLPECQALGRGFDWSQDESDLPGALLEHIRHLRRDQREPAEREALRIVRLASSRGAVILTSVADQLNDADLFATFLSQPGGEFGRAVWMRAHSDATARLFEIAESILNTADIRGNKRLYDAFDVPCDEPPPPFLWNDKVKRELELELTQAMRLAEPCEVVHVALADESDGGEASVAHCLVVRFAGEQVTAVQVVNRNRRSFCYFPARDATLVYAPSRKVVEVYAHTLSTRAPLANVLSAHGFKVPLSSRPLNRSRFDLSRFALPLKEAKPRLDGAKVERLYLAEARALLGHASDTVTIHLDSGAELHDVMGERWGNHPFSQPAAILGVTLVAELVFSGETTETPLSIVLAEPGRCSLQSERDLRLRLAGTQLLEALGVLRPLNPGSGMDDPDLIGQVARLLECATSPMDGFALAQLGIDIERFEDEGILTEGDRITQKVVELADGMRCAVPLERCADANFVRYRDPLTGDDVMLQARHARRWKVHLNWLREEIITALGSTLQGVRGRHLDEEPVFLGELDVDSSPVALYFATRMGSERQYARVDAALRLRPRAVPGIVLTTSTAPFPFAGTNVVVPIHDVLSPDQSGTAVDLTRLKVLYRHGHQAAMGGTAISLKVSADGYAAQLSVPGRAPWRVTGKAKIAVLQRLVDAYAAGTPHVNTKKLMEDTGCATPANLFSKTSPWRDYLVRVKGAHAWQLNLPSVEEPLEDEAAEALPE
ncbi:hypothetical protein [Ralstonia pseudosolanacearum]|uniref:hypothetical protein n=1 Tax=Ralstonia pseudosolanacearum TaxID=1310165 RepID=UPI001FFAA5F9|nr:hypothetical protein [Ralstonia pseudosolanacearum]